VAFTPESAPLPGKLHGELMADAPARPGDDRDFSSQFIFHIQALSSCPQKDRIRSRLARISLSVSIRHSKLISP
jgi:hypothetical protein